MHKADSSNDSSAPTADGPRIRRADAVFRVKSTVTRRVSFQRRVRVGIRVIRSCSVLSFLPSPPAPDRTGRNDVVSTHVAFPARSRATFRARDLSTINFRQNHTRAINLWGAKCRYTHSPVDRTRAFAIVVNTPLQECVCKTTRL